MKKGRRFSAEDRMLWSKVARSTRPMPGRLEDLVDFEEELAAAEKPIDASPKSLSATVSTGAVVAAGPSEPANKPAQGHHHPLERPVKRKLARGHLALEARLDLHGLVQSEAHAVLLDFLWRAHARGLRHVLVITGKGSSLGSEGALKRAVPMWFSKPDFRGLISSYEPAAHHHGGDGALYVRLSRPRGEPR
ncbi:Smr/MutS family protein [Rhizobium halophytocola]|uniref:DNA-nicking Smr family endonuclease n=1 Tax=Rhizobium halophytocola TaxID=735519 RepID=A0ABS4E1N5_9HYPH|nr:Smr/MutS family protein [Rhizobium halophytocola]MBP1851841.1 DNA-nicking Smr family endonuclease [Rhizobium halophytocola]